MKLNALNTPLSLHEPDNINNQSDMSTPAEKKGKKKRTPLVESEVRRSPRLKEINKGFKADSCASKKCLACNPNPPDLSLEMVKKLGTGLCKIDEDLLTEKALNQKKKRSCKTINKRALKENLKPNDAIAAAQDDKEAESQKKGKTKKTARKKEIKKNVRPAGDDHDLQDEEGANSSAPEDDAPKER